MVLPGDGCPRFVADESDSDGDVLGARWRESSRDGTIPTADICVSAVRLDMFKAKTANATVSVAQSVQGLTLLPFRRLPE